MFFEKQYSLDLWYQPSLKLLKVFPAIKQTFFLIFESNTHHKYFQYYRLVDKDGLFLFEYTNEMPLRAQKQFLPIMTNDKELLFFNVSKNQEWSVRIFACNCFCSASINVTAYYFHETNVVGLFEGEYCGNEVLKLRVTYINMLGEIMKERQSERLQNGSIQVFKSNCQSMILSFKRREMLIYVFTLSKMIKIDVGQSISRSAILGAWEYKSNHILVAINKRNNFRNYVISLRKKSIRKRSYFHNHEQRFHTCKLLSIKNYYYSINNSLYYNYYKFYKRDDKLLFKLKVPSDRHRQMQHLHLLEHRNAFVVFYQQQKKSSTKLIVKQVSVWSEKQMSMHFMLHINQDFVDELLSDVTRLL